MKIYGATEYQNKCSAPAPMSGDVVHIFFRFVIGKYSVCVTCELTCEVFRE